MTRNGPTGTSKYHALSRDEGVIELVENIEVRSGLDHPAPGLDGLDHPGSGLDGLDRPVASATGGRFSTA
jgi:hypothetical protein